MRRWIKLARWLVSQGYHDANRLQRRQLLRSLRHKIARTQPIGSCRVGDEIEILRVAEGFR